MAALDPAEVRKAIAEAGHTWRFRRAPGGRAGARPRLAAGGAGGGRARHRDGEADRTGAAAPRAARPAPTPDATARLTVPQALAGLPAVMDWRTRDVIGPVTDQRRAAPASRSRPRAHRGDGGDRARRAQPAALGGRPALLLVARRELRRLEQRRLARPDQVEGRRHRARVPLHERLRQPAGERSERHRRLARPLPRRQRPRVPLLPHHRLQRVARVPARPALRRAQVLPRQRRARSSAASPSTRTSTATAAASTAT